MRTMYDSVTAADIPSDAKVVAGYINGRYAWSEADWARFPSAQQVRITITAATNDGDVLDVEQGDATPDEAPGWIRARQAAGLAVPTIYCSRSVLPTVRAVCDGLRYDVWTADYTGVPHLGDGSAATQYADPAFGSGGHYDVSLCADWW